MPCKHDRRRTRFAEVLILSLTLIFFSLSLPFTSDALGQENKVRKKAEKNYQRAEKLFTQEKHTKALLFYTKAAEQGHTKAQLSLGDLYFDGKGVAADCNQGDFWYRQALKSNDAPAQYSLARRFEHGRGDCVKKDDRRAAEWYSKAAEQGHTKAQARLGLLLLGGRRGVKKDEEQATAWLGKAAEKGDAEAQHGLAWLYEEKARNSDEDMGKIEQGFRKAIVWYRKAAEQGHVRAQISLGWLYHKEQYPLRYVIAPDATRAVEWFGKAAEQGNALAQNYVGLFYQEGRGVEQDDAKALEWYRKAAEQDDVHGQIRLAWLYQSGKGVERDYAQAARLYRQATDAMSHADVRYFGEGYAGYPIGGYADRIGIEKNIPIAYTLFLISDKKIQYRQLKREVEIAQSRIEVVEKKGGLTEEQIADAKKIAETWNTN